MTTENAFPWPWRTPRTSRDALIGAVIAGAFVMGLTYLLFDRPLRAIVIGLAVGLVNLAVGSRMARDYRD